MQCKHFWTYVCVGAEVSSQEPRLILIFKSTTHMGQNHGSSVEHQNFTPGLRYHDLQFERPRPWSGPAPGGVNWPPPSVTPPVESSSSPTLPALKRSHLPILRGLQLHHFNGVGLASGPALHSIHETGAASTNQSSDVVSDSREEAGVSHDTITVWGYSSEQHLCLWERLQSWWMRQRPCDGPLHQRRGGRSTLTATVMLIHSPH